MTSPYAGVSSFSTSLNLITDADPPMALTVREPNERLLDNDIHLRNRVNNLDDDVESLGNRVVAVEAVSNIAALVTATSITPLFLATKTLTQNEAALGQRWKFSAQVQVVRGATATPTNVYLRITAGGSAVHTLTKALNTTNGYTGTFRFEGEISFHSAPSAAAAFTVTCLGVSTVVSATPEIDLPTPGLALTAATNVGFTIDVIAGLSAAVAGCSITPIFAGIHRIKP